MYLNSIKNIWSTRCCERLTLTWDVFKYIYIKNIEFFSPRLTLTWDVFKFFRMSAYVSCIFWLTLTWDVFKF